MDRLLERLSRRLETRFRRAARNPGWPWPEAAVTYEGALLPRALLAAGRRLDRPELVRLGRDSLDWLIAGLIDRGGQFHPVGNHGWWPVGGDPARFDQQPIEAGSLIAAVETALNVTGDPRYLVAAEAAFAWFQGANDLGLSVAVPERGACHDGLGPDGLNRNQGAESTLAWLASVERIRRIRAGGLASRPVSQATVDQSTGQRSGSAGERGSGRGHDRTYSSRAS